MNKTVKKYWIKAVIIIMSILTSFSAIACTNINIDTAKKVCAALEEKYGEEFEATHIGGRSMGDPTAKLYVHPKNNESLVFTVITDPSGKVDDDYSVRLVMNEVEKELVGCMNDVGIICVVNAIVTVNGIDETNRQISPNEFVKKHQIDSVLVTIALNEQGLNADKTYEALQEFSLKYNFDMSTYVFVYDAENYALCSNAFKTSPHIGVTGMKSYDPKSWFSTVLSNGGISLGVDEIESIIGGN